MSETAQNAKVLCYYSPEVAESLRQVGLEVFPASGEVSDRPVYDWAPALYVHAPQLVAAPIPDGGPQTYKVDRELHAVFSKALKEAGARPLPQQVWVPNWTCLPPRLGESIKSGCILGVVFAAKVAVEDRLAVLPWGAWREAARLRGLSMVSIGCPTRHEVSLRRWRETWKVPIDLLSLAPSVEYTADLLKDLLPVLPPPTTWTAPVAGQTVSAESLRRERIARRQSDIGGVRPPGFHFKVEEPPMAVFPASGGPAWASSLLPPDGLKVRVVIQAHNCDSAQKETVQQAVAKTYQVDPSVVQIVLLFVNRLGDWLGVAVRIGKGAILILPEFPDKAAMVKRLVTDLWGPVHEWLAEQSRANTAGPPKPDAGPARRVFPALTAPSGPQIKAGSKMDTLKITPEELKIAQAVDDLVLDAGNRTRFRKEIEVFRKELVGRTPKDGPFRPGDHPSQAMMFALLAYLHDECLEDSPAIFDPPISTPLKALQYWENAKPMWRACSSYMMSEKIAPIRVATLEGYLKRVRAWLEEDARQASRAADAAAAHASGTGPAQPPENMSPQMRAIAMILEHPDWTNKTIADALGLNPKTLSKPTWSHFKAVRKKAKQNLRMMIPHGSKDGETGDIDATDE